MPVDPLGGTLGSIALLFPIYDACNRMFRGCKDMKTFGRDVLILWRALEGQFVILKCYMDIDRRDLEDPPDPDNPNHAITSAILGQLSILETYFGKCEEIVCTFFKQRAESEKAQSTAEATDDRTTSQTNRSTVTTPSVSTTSSAAPSSEKKKFSIHGLVPKKWARAGSKDREHSDIRPAKPPPTHVETRNLLSGPVHAANGHAISSRGPASHELVSQTGFWDRVKWAHHGRPNFSAYLVEIERANRTLQRILKLKSPKTSSQLLAPESIAEPSEGPLTTGAIRQALQRLHKALCAINRRRPESAVFSISMSADIPDNRLVLDHLIAEKDLWVGGKAYESSLGQEAEVFWLLVRDRHVETQSTFLMVEVAQAIENRKSAVPSHESPKIEDLSELRLSADQPEDNLYSVVGAIPPYVGPEHTIRSEHHQVFRERSRWTRVRTLADVVSNPEMARTLDARTVSKLASTILTAYSNFAAIRSECDSFRLDNIEYFRSPSSSQSPTEELEVSAAYIACGFGERLPIRRPGAASGPKKDPSHAVLELGLLLYQLGARVKKDYQPSTLEASRWEALEDMTAVVHHAGTVFAGIVEMLLRSRVENELEAVEVGVRELDVFEATMDRYRYLGSRQRHPAPALEPVPETVVSETKS